MTYHFFVVLSWVISFNGPIIRVEQGTIVKNVNLRSNCDYNMVLLYGFTGYKQGAVTPKRTRRPLDQFYFKIKLRT